MNPLLIQLLLGIGASVGSSFVTNPQLKAVISDSLAAVTQLIGSLANRVPGSPAITAATFLTVIQAATAVLIDTKQITAEEGAALTKAVSDTFAADKQAQIVVDWGSLTPLVPLP